MDDIIIIQKVHQLLWKIHRLKVDKLNPVRHWADLNLTAVFIMSSPPLIHPEFGIFLKRSQLESQSDYKRSPLWQFLNYTFFFFALQDSGTVSSALKQLSVQFLIALLFEIQILSMHLGGNLQSFCISSLSFQSQWLLPIGSFLASLNSTFVPNPVILPKTGLVSLLLAEPSFLVLARICAKNMQMPQDRISYKFPSLGDPSAQSLVYFSSFLIS